MIKHYQALGKNSANFIALTPISFLNRTADVFATRTALVYGQRQYTWQQVQTRVRRLASALRAHGVGSGDTVSVLAANTPEMFEAQFAVPMSDAVLNTINYRLEARTISYILEHSDAKVLLTDTAFAPVVREALSHLNKELLVIDIVDTQLRDQAQSDRLGSVDYETFLAAGDPDFAWPGPADEWQALALNYTSGTSGKPKGVVYHHRGAYLMAMGTVAAWNLPQHPRYLYTVPMFHCNGWGHAWTMTLMAGTIFLTRDVTAQVIFEAVADHHVSHFGGAPVVLAMLTDAPEDQRRPFSHHVRVMTAGAPPPAIVLEKVQALGFEVMQVYGLTETFGHVTQCLWRDEWDEEPFARQAQIKAWQGVALPMTEQAAVVDLDSGKLVPRDGQSEGEIVLRGNTVMSGYYKDAEATQAAFSNNWFHSGDAAVWREGGYIQITDRLKDVIISGGENISSVEVEGVLYRHPAIAAAAVVAMPHEKWGEVPCAFVELRDGEQVASHAVMAFCKEHLASFKTPKKVVFGELPKTATGKIQKFKLREQLKKGNAT